jgi:serine/threonine protein kinase
MGRLGSSKDPLSVYMVFPYMDHDLAGLLENERVKLQPSHIKLYMRQLLEGTAYMHKVSSIADVMHPAFTTCIESYSPS